MALEHKLYKINTLRTGLTLNSGEGDYDEEGAARAKNRANNSRNNSPLRKKQSSRMNIKKSPSVNEDIGIRYSAKKSDVEKSYGLDD